jgi:hypothetical protein
MGDRRASIKIEFSMHGKTKKADMWINWSPSDYDGVDQRVLDFFSEAAQDGKCKLCVDGCIACDARAQPAQEPVVGTRTWFENGKVVTQRLTAKDIYKEPEQEPNNFCPRCGKRAQGVLGQLQVHTCTPPLWGYK